MRPEAPLYDPFRAWGALLSGLEGSFELEKIRRGMWIHATAPRPPVGLTPHRVIHRQDKLSLRYYAPAQDRGLPPLVLVPSLINRAYILDLEPDRSLVAGMAALGHPVYLVDWGTPGPEDADEDVGYVLMELLHRSIDRAVRHARAPGAVLFGYCQGGTLAAMYTALRPQKVAGLIALNAPVHFAHAGRFGRFVAPEALDVDQAFPAGTLVPTAVMRPAFQLLDPVGSFTKYAAIEAASADPLRLARTMARERWLEENVPLPSAFAREFIRRAYQEDALLAGTWPIRGERVRLEAITAPLLVVACRNDFIAPAASVLPLASRVGSAQVTVEEPESGHIGIVVGATGPRVFYPMLDRWIRRVVRGAEA